MNVWFSKCRNVGLRINSWIFPALCWGIRHIGTGGQMGNKAHRYRSTDGAEFQHYRFTLGMLGLNKFCTFPSWNSQTHPLRLVIGWRQGWQDLALRFLRANWRACPVASVCPGIVVDAFIDPCSSYIRRYWAKLSPARTWQHILLCSRPSPVLVLLWPVITSALHWNSVLLCIYNWGRNMQPVQTRKDLARKMRVAAMLFWLCTLTSLH